MMQSLPLLMRRCLCCCQASMVTLVAHCQAGVVALVMMAISPSMRRHLCHHCDCTCCPHDNGIIASVNVQASLLLSIWCCCPCNNGVVALDLQHCCCPCYNGLIAILQLALLPLSKWRRCHHQCAGVLPIIAMALLPSLQWHCFPQYAGIFAIIAIAIDTLNAMVSLP
jgi:hypothetical protein